MKIYTLSVNDQKAEFLEELLQSLQFVNFREVTPNEIEKAQKTATAEHTTKAKDNQLAQLRNAINSIESLRSNRNK